jgi:hypothetical protein
MRRVSVSVNGVAHVVIDTVNTSVNGVAHVVIDTDDTPAIEMRG